MEGKAVIKNWKRIDVTCGDETADILAAEFSEAFGVGVEYTAEGIRIYLDSNRFTAEEKRLREVVESVGLPADESEIGLSITEIPDEDWSRNWKVHFKPLRVGRRFIVSPTWEEPGPDPERLIIRIDPGRAFGTGHHETTRLCLEWLETCGDVQLLSLLDIGTGSGILSIGAALLGFRSVLGIDNDPEAVETARENIEINRLSERVRTECATPEEISGRFDVIIANIQSVPLIRMSEDIASKVRDGGRLALSGILEEQADEVSSAYEKRGLKRAGVRSEGEWVLLAFDKERVSE